MTYARLEQRIYARERGGMTRYYADFRDFREYGGRQEALRPAGSRTATTVLAEAEQLVRQRHAELERFCLNQIVGLQALEHRHLGAYIEHHLQAKGAVKDGVSAAWLGQCRRHLAEARSFFGAQATLAEITPARIGAYLVHLGSEPVGRSGNGEASPLSSSTMRKYLMSLSNLFRRAVSERLLLNNPVADLFDGKPSTTRGSRTEWLEVHEAALLLEAARLLCPHRRDLSVPFHYELIATLLLTGGRWAEVAGLQVRDVRFDRDLVVFRENHFRRLKTTGADRVVPLWAPVEAHPGPLSPGSRPTYGNPALPGLEKGRRGVHG